METKNLSPQFGDFLLTDGRFVKDFEDLTNVRGFYLTNGVSLLALASKKRTYYKAELWTRRQGGCLPELQTLDFIYENLDEVNKLLIKLAKEPIVKDTVWSCSLDKEKGLTKLRYTKNFANGKSVSAIAECVVLDDCATAATITIC